MDTKLFARKQPGGLFAVTDREFFPSGSVWWVGSTVSGASDAAGFGRNPDAPLATLDYAIGLCTASVGDVIFLLPGHAETKAVTGSLWAADIVGIKIIGLGQGADRPAFTFSHTGAATTISAASVWLENVVLVCGVDSVLLPLTISAADVTLKNVEFRDAANVEFVVGVQTTNAADRLHIDGLHYRGDVATGNALTIGIDLAGVNDALIENCIFESKAASTAWVNMSVNSYNVHVRNCIFNDVTVTLSKDVVDTAGASTWDAINCWDLRGGYAFSGGSGSSLASGDVSALAAAITTVDGYFDAPTKDAVTDTTIRDAIGRKTDTTAAGAVSEEESLMAYAKQNVAAGIAAAASLVILDEFHDVPAQNAVVNAQINEVIGNKTDTAGSGAVTDTSSLVKYTKQLVNEIAVVDGYFDAPTKDAATDTTIRDAIGRKTDTTAAGAVSEEKSLMAYAKQNVAAGIAAAASLVILDEFHDVPAQNAVVNAQINEVIGNKTDTAGSGAVTDTSSLVKYAKQLVNETLLAPRCVVKTGLAVDGGTVADVFTIAGGPIQLLGLNAIFTEAVSAHACLMSFNNDPDLATATDTEMCAGVDCQSAAVGSVFSIIDSDGASAAVIDATGTNVGRFMEIGTQFIQAGGIDLIMADATPESGIVTVYLTYRPLVAGTTVVAN